MEKRINGLDLFSGIGGNTLALRKYVRTLAYCEADRHAQSVLLSRMADGGLEPAPIWDDVSTLTRAHFDVPVDIVVAGFPCQDISAAGAGRGLAGERSGLVFQVFRLVEELKPAFVFLENVPAIRSRGGERVVKELAGLGYDCRWDVLSASDVGAPHKRDRWFLLAAYPDRLPVREQPGQRRQEDGGVPALAGEHGSQEHVADPVRLGFQEGQDERARAEESGGRAGPAHGSGWPAEPGICRVADGLPLRVDRVKRLGNAVVPAQAREAFQRLMGLKPS